MYCSILSNFCNSPDTYMHYSLAWPRRCVDRDTWIDNMVRVLSSGELVQDNDPRLARQTGNRQRQAQVSNTPRVSAQVRVIVHNTNCLSQLMIVLPTPPSLPSVNFNLANSSSTFSISALSLPPSPSLPLPSPPLPLPQRHHHHIFKIHFGTKLTKV